MSSNDELMTLEEAAKFLKVSPRTLWEMARRGDIPSHRIGAQWRFTREDLLTGTKTKTEEQK